jgi:hypothetical protein
MTLKKPLLKLKRFPCSCGSQCHKVCTSPYCCDCGQGMSVLVDSRKSKKRKGGRNG